MPIYSPTGYLDITNAILRTSNIDTQGITAQTIRIGDIEIIPTYGLEHTSNVGNTVSNVIQFTNETTSLVTSGNVAVGRDLTVTGNVTVSDDLTVTGNALVSSNLTVTGNVTVSDDLTVTGNTFYTNPMSISVDSNVVAEYTGPHDRPLRKYPEVAMTADDNSSTSGYIASTSTSPLLSTGGDGDYASYFAFLVFNQRFGITFNAWHSSADYDTSSGSYNGADPSLGRTTIDNTNYDGHYIQLQLPNRIKLSYLTLRPQYDATSGSQWHTRLPKDFIVFGSIDGSNWNIVKSISGLTGTESVDSRANINSVEYYNYFRLLVTKNGGNAYTTIGELAFYGHEEGDSSLDTTLKSVYNVPGTQQLEVYYDAKDLTAMPGTVTDLAGGDQNGTVTGATLDETGGINSFAFNGTSQYITASYSDLPNITDHTLAFWMKVDSTATNNDYVVTLGTNDTNKMIAFNLSGGTNQARLHFDNWNSGVATKNNVYQIGQWVHVVGTMLGTVTGKLETQFIYVNGVKQTCLVTGAVNDTLILSGRNEVTIGARPNNAGSGALTYTAFFDGSVANVRFFSKALNADQIKELYDYQKDYFLGTRSSVTLYKGHLGIGVAEPSGQLELAGDERIQEYPPRALTGYETLVEGHGVFCAIASSTHYSTEGWKAFPPNSNGVLYWASGYGLYSQTSGAAGGVYAGSQRLSATTELGEYLILELPYKIILSKVFISARSSHTFKAPSNFTIYGSNNNSDWYTLLTVTGATPSQSGGNYYPGGGDSGTSTSIGDTTPYKYLAIVVSKTAGGSDIGDGTNSPGSIDAMMIANISYFGTPGPTTLDKGSLSLTRSLDVPRISRYDVDTETPRPEKLVVDFDTTVNSSPTDISGQGNHGTLVGATYSAADKAFSFSGANGSNIRLSSTTPFPLNTDPDLSFSVWVKVDVATSTAWRGVWELGNRGASENVGVYIPASSNGVGPNQFNFTLWGSDLITGEAVEANRWYHLAGAYTAATKTRQFYVDGILKGTVTTSTGMFSSLDPANPPLTLGTNSTTSYSEGLAGDISNFKLYKAALEASEVQKLYRLGRTGRSMVISDTAVGIGKVPEAQLDVRGNLRVSGHAFPETIAPRYYTSIKTGIFTGQSNPILTGFDNVADGHSEPMGWEVHINFQTTATTAIEVVLDGFYTSNSPSTHRTIGEHGTRRQRQDNAGTTFYDDKFYLGSYIEHTHTPVYSVIRIINPHGQHSSIYTYNSSTMRYHAWGESIYVHPGVGTTIDYGMGSLAATGANQRLHAIRLAAESGGLTGAYTIFAIK